MNRGGLAGATWELDDRFTAYDTDHLIAANLDAGKMLLRIDDADAGTVPTLHSCARRTATQRPSHDGDGRADPVHEERRRPRGMGSRSPQALAGRGRVRGFRRLVGLYVAQDSGHRRHRHDRGDDDATAAAPRGCAGSRSGGHVANVERALQEPTVRGLVVGRALLYPPDGDVAASVARAAELVDARGEGLDRSVTAKPASRPARRGCRGHPS